MSTMLASQLRSNIVKRCQLGRRIALYRHVLGVPPEAKLRLWSLLASTVVLKIISWLLDLEIYLNDRIGRTPTKARRRAEIG